MEPPINADEKQKLKNGFVVRCLSLKLSAFIGVNRRLLKGLND